MCATSILETGQDWKIAAITISACVHFLFGGVIMDEKIYKELLKLARSAQKHGDFPVGALIVCNEKIISKAYNKRNKSNITTDHAEIIAIIKACKRKKSWRLNDCDLYVTLEPCNMCKTIIIESRIKNVYYLLSRDKSKNQYKGTKFKQIESSNNKLVKEYKDKISTFFSDKRW